MFGRTVQSSLIGRWSTCISRFPSTSIRGVQTAGCIIIGDEVLNSKITDTNSRYFAKFCYDRGIDLKKVSVVGDDSQDIVETVLEFSSKYDFIVSSGGIGPTHDDITYESIAAAFSLPLELDHLALEKFGQIRSDKFMDSLDEHQREAHLKMFRLPTHKDRVKSYYIDGKWVPIVTIDEKFFILPGIPKLFKELLDKGIAPQIEPRMSQNLKNLTFFVKTKMSESKLAPTLSALQHQAQEQGSKIKLGSYPHMGKGVNTVSITGKANEAHHLRKLVDSIVTSLEGTEISREEEEILSES
ncbi:unnamed protein product [Kuraishia capsulata CBS 1993]|uniref:MoaB/Mog domain-containing protein n=1 Tax=Kuraishia capsulata CBS 1993 TaxID=1382522 RepID=W6MMG3_9ASCO|nr:uncharacterized protein KUCA_T00003758001 [Kuraishia capsulata CBS 1993]CDK27779.1 unnamed protein product [Kuraishia capsulata CBS 1993]